MGRSNIRCACYKRVRILWYLEQHDEVMADRGFTIAEDLLLQQAKLHIPPGKRGQEQFSKSEVKKTKEIANLRIYIKQATRRLKRFRLIKNELPISMLGNLDNIIIVCAAICNLNKPLCKPWYRPTDNLHSNENRVGLYWKQIICGISTIWVTDYVIGIDLHQFVKNVIYQIERTPDNKSWILDILSTMKMLWWSSSLGRTSYHYLLLIILGISGNQWLQSNIGLSTWKEMVVHFYMCLLLSLWSRLQVIYVKPVLRILQWEPVILV